MDSSSLYFDRRDKLDSPVVSPILDRFMPRAAMEDSAYFTTPNGAFSTLQGDAYTLAPRSVDHRDPTGGAFSLDFLPTADTMPRAYPAGTLDPSVTTNTTSPGDPTFCDIDPSRALYNDRDSSEECLSGGLHGQAPVTFDSSYSFLPSPGCRRSASSGAPANGNKQRVERKKRRRHSTPVVSAKDKQAPGGPGGPGDEKRRSTTQLRTASRAPKRYSQSTARKPAETAEEVKARAAHNQVEQQYRKRLNAQFERLLAGGGCRMGMEKRISKAEVLDLARRRIKLLERERASLERQKDELLGSVGRMQEEWTRRLGGPMPTAVKVER
ncbi:unnamed protein product [Parascedosporium putredinis]|uniref:BHLH domain-containing protein n=1 Tax=Parascedosporium putredinis TaxID=1442378 RepID=A0A9P1M888_9PEZI|nr:unnamed protein product [Parascedosporium putredinis]CAI7989425.1 unnamed protein product [Parascedosporium putredinis]